MAISLAGCGSSTGNPDLASDELNLTGTDIVFGRAILNGPAQGATAQITDLSDISLGFRAVSVDSTGNFRIPVNFDSLPSEFRVAVSLGSDSEWNLPIIANVNGYDGTEAVFCNIPTTISALYQQKKAVSKEQANSFVRQAFQIPSDIEIGWGIDESRRSHFRHSVFLEKAASKGGVAACVSSLVESGPVSPQFGEVATAIAVKVATNLALDAIGTVIGTVTQAIGLNVGSPDYVAELGEDLSSIISDVVKLGSAVETDFSNLENIEAARDLFDVAQSLVTELDDPVADIQAQTVNLADVAREASITNSPFTQSSSTQSKLATIAAYDAQVDLRLLSNVLLGKTESPSLLKIYRELLAFELGVPPLDLSNPSAARVWASSPVLSNPLLFDPYENFFNYYIQHQLMGLNLLVENANAALDQGTIEEAQSTSAGFQRDFVEEAEFLGIPLDSDDYLANPGAAFETRMYQPVPETPSGTIFCTQIQAPVFAYDPGSVEIVSESVVFNTLTLTYESDEAAQFIHQSTLFSFPGYGQGWRLPSLDELTQLRALALQANSTDAVAGLQSLGFSSPSENWDGTVWYLNLDSNTAQGTYQKGSLDNGIILIDQQVQGTVPVQVFDFSDGTSRGTDATDIFTSLFGQKYPFLLVNYQSFDSSQGYDQIVAAGFRPTEAPVLSLTSEGNRVSATFGGVGVNQHCTWISSDSRQLDVVSVGDEAGQLQWHPGVGTLRDQTITASWQGMDPSSGRSRHLSASIAVPVPTPVPTRSLERIVLSPSNTILPDSSTNTLFEAIGFYSDQSIENLSGQVSWSIELPNGFPYPPHEATINGSVPGILIFFTPFITDPVVTVNASFGGVTGSTRVEVAVP